MMTLKEIAIFSSPLKSKFGIPKQSGLVAEIPGCIVFNPDYNNPDYIRGIEGFNYLWLIWGFSANAHAPSSPLVRPPVLGGNEKVGVFATRSPFRPNALGLSSVRLNSVEINAQGGMTLHVSGADLMDGTPIYDIKPYLPYADCHDDAQSGFLSEATHSLLQVEIPSSIAAVLTEQQLTALHKILELDPRPHYHQDADRIYGMPFYEYDVKFQVADGKAIVVDIDNVMTTAKQTIAQQLTEKP